MQEMSASLEAFVRRHGAVTARTEMHSGGDIRVKYAFHRMPTEVWRPPLPFVVRCCSDLEFNAIRFEKLEYDHGHFRLTGVFSFTEGQGHSGAATLIGEGETAWVAMSNARPVPARDGMSGEEEGPRWRRRTK